MLARNFIYHTAASSILQVLLWAIHAVQSGIPIPWCKRWRKLPISTIGRIIDKHQIGAWQKC